MGAERWLRFVSPKEARKCQEYLGGDTFIGVVGEFGVHLEWTKTTILEVGYSHCYLNRACAEMVCREIANRFLIRAIGADSVGWFKGTVPDGYSSWVEWIKSYDPTKPTRKYEEEYVVEYAAIDLVVKRYFLKLDEEQEP